MPDSSATLSWHCQDCWLSPLLYVIVPSVYRREPMTRELPTLARGALGAAADECTNRGLERPFTTFLGIIFNHMISQT